MVEQFRERVRELAVRAGLAGVPEPVLLAVLVLVVVVCFVVGLRTWQTYVPESAAASGAVPANGTAQASAGAGSKSQDSGGTRPGSGAGSGASYEASQAVVYVSGRVRRPGVYPLAAGSRVADAISAAGGTIAGADCSQVNLARVVKDGEQLTVPKAGERPTVPSSDQAAAPGGGSVSGAAPAGAPDAATVDLNTADEAAFDALPGIGPSTAKKIVADRDKNGRFKSAQDLMRVPGIGPKKFDTLKDLVTVGP